MKNVLRKRRIGIILFLGNMLFSMLLKAVNPPVVQWATSNDRIYTDTHSSAVHSSDWTEKTINTDGGNNYVAVGYTWSGAAGSGDCEDIATYCLSGVSRSAVAYKLDYQGNVIATTVINDFGGVCPMTNPQNQNVLQDVVEMDAGGYVACGYDQGKLIVVELDKTSFAATVHTFELGTLIVNTDSYFGYSIKKVYALSGSTLVEDGFIIAGAHKDPNTLLNNVYYLRLHADFSFWWSQTVTKNSKKSTAYSVAPIYYYGTQPDGKPTYDIGSSSYVASGQNLVQGFLVAGYIDDGSGSLDYNAWLLKTDIDGNLPSTSNAGLSLTTNSNASSTSTNDYWDEEIASGGSINSLAKDHFQTSLNTGTFTDQGTYDRFSIATINCTPTTYTGGDLANIYSDNTLNNDYGRDVAQLMDGSIVVACEFHDFELSGSCTTGNASFDHEYKDIDAVLIKWTSATVGSTKAINTGVPNLAKEVAHGDGGDFKTKFREMSNTDFVVTCSSADYGVLFDPSHDLIEAVLYRFDNSLTNIWTKAMSSHAMFGNNISCIFSLSLTADGGYILSGNDGTNHDDNIFIKLSNECQNNAGGTIPATSGTILGSTGLLTGVVNGTWTLTGNLILDNCHFQFLDTKLINDYFVGPPTPGGGIYVPFGLTLTLQNGTTLEGYDGCNATHDMWDGIIVQGQPGVVPQSSVTQGSIVVSSSTIADARYGIVLGGLSDGGGILTATNSSFLNCRNGIYFGPYSDPNNLSSIKNCTFNCTQPLAGFGGEGVLNHFIMNGVNKITFETDQFLNDGAISPKYSDCNGQGTGIYSYNCDISILENNTPGTPGACDPTLSNNNAGKALIFANLDNGIIVDKQNNVNHDTKIWLCQFSNVKSGITVSNGIAGDALELWLNYSSFSNDILPATFSGCVSQAYYGIHLIDCDHYIVNNNRLHIQPPFFGAVNNYIIDGIWSTRSGVNNSLLGFNQNINENVAPYPGSTGVNSIGMLFDGTDGQTKNIVIYGTNISSVTAPQNWTDIMDNDDHFLQTPPTSPFPADGVDNLFTATGSTGLNFQISGPGSTFGYNYFTSGLAPTLLTSATPSSSATDENADVSSPFNQAQNFCMDITKMPADVLRNRSSQNGQTNLFYPSQIADQGAKAMVFDIYPNPFANLTTIAYNLPGHQNSIIEIYDMLGKMIEIIGLENEQGQYSLEAGNMKPGLYYYTLKSNDIRLKTANFVIASH